jgi:hypothetical protein
VWCAVVRVVCVSCDQQEESVRTHLFEAVSVFYSSMGKFPLLLAALIEDDLSATPKCTPPTHSNLSC